VIDDIPDEVRARWEALPWEVNARLFDLASASARTRPEAWLVCASPDVDADVRVSHAEFMQIARRAAAGLRRRGVRPGDVVAVQLPASIEAVVAHAACGLAGAVLLPIVHIYGAHELAFVLRESGAKLLITAAAVKGIAQRPLVAGLADLPALSHHITVGDEAADNWSSLLAADPSEDDPGGVPQDVALLIYTSGTTSNPKGVQHSHRSLSAELSLGIGDFVGPGDAMLCPWPPGHIAGYLMLARFWALGFNTVLMEQWDPALAARLVDQYKVVLTQGTPYHLSGLLDAAERDGRDLTSIKEYVAGATIVSPALMERSTACGIVTLRSFGLSECPTASRSTRLDPLEKRINTDGRACPGVEIRILGDDDRDLPLGEQGEVVLRAPETFLGYRDSALNNDAFLPGGWLRTGDIGRLDPEGYLSITDRKKDIIIRGGENISSREIEELTAKIPGVHEVAAVGIRDERLGERVCVVVALKDRTELSLEEVSEHFQSLGVARQKTPERVFVVKDFPRTSSGKIKKHELRSSVTEVEK
jgi:acyl-CoA synthetase (AMP-forming)/AMP-acid ligase II